MQRLTMKTQYGFTLIEVLVAFFILGVGLLGLSSLMTQGVRANQGAYLRTQAIVLAQDMADRIRANPESDYLMSAGANSGCVAISRDAQGCGPDAMAANDLYEWEQLLQSYLPAATGVVCLDSNPDDGDASDDGCDGTADIYAVKVFWDGDRDGTADQRFAVRVTR